MALLSSSLSWLSTSSSSSSSRLWFLFIATFLTFSAMTLTSEGQPQPQVLLVTQPEPQYYVTKDEPANITCEALGATTISFMCLGAPAAPRDITTYQSYDDARMNTRIRTTLKVRWTEVEAVTDSVRGAGFGREEVGDYWCQCTAHDEDRFVSVSSRRAVVSLAVLEKEFQESPESQVVMAGSRTVLTCVPPHGEPMPQVSWRKDGHRLKVEKGDNLVLGDDNSLTIVETGVRDGGSYQCVAANVAGRRTSQMASVFVEDLGNPQAPQALTTQDEEKEEDDAPKDRASRQLTVPVFVEQPSAEYYITPTQPVTFSCAVRGAERVTVKCNNRRIDGVRTETDDVTRLHRVMHTLSYPEVVNFIEKVAVPHYQCVCVAWYLDPGPPRKWAKEESTSSLIHPAYLDAVFQSEPRDRMVQVGTTAVLQCGAPKGMPAPTVSWAFEGQRIDPDIDRRYMISGDGTLTIQYVDNRDQGRYYCLAENSVGSKRSQVATLTVTDETIPVTTPPTTPAPTTFPAVIPDHAVFVKDLDSEYSVDWDGNAMLVCSAVSADQLIYRCMGNRLGPDKMDSKEIRDPASGKKMLTSSVVVTSEELEAVQPGTYTCQCVAWYRQNQQWATLMSNEATVMPAYIDSMFQLEPRSQSFYEGDMVELGCLPPQGKPSPRVYWLKDNEELDVAADDNLEQLEEGSLIIDSVRLVDAGQYTCVGANPAGRKTSQPATVEVYRGAVTRQPTPTTTPSVATEGQPDMMTTTMDTPSTTYEDEFLVSTLRSGKLIPYFLEDLPEERFVIPEGAIFNCGAVETRRLLFFCNGANIDEQTYIDRFSFRDEASGLTSDSITLHVKLRDVQRQARRGQEFVCQCRAYYLGDDGQTYFVASTNTTFREAYMNKVFAEMPLDQTVEAGVQTELRCRPPMGGPLPMVTWTKDDHPVTLSDVVRVHDEGSLWFLSPSPSDSGIYRCIAGNDLGNVTSSPARLHVIGGEPEPEGEGEEESTPEPEGEGEGEGTPEGGEGGGGQMHGMLRFRVEPETVNYIIRSKPVNISCEAFHADQIIFICNEESVPQSRVSYGGQELTVQGEYVMAASIDVSREEVENYNDQRGGNHFHCKCQAVSNVQSKSVDSRSGYVEVAYLKKMFDREPFNVTARQGQFLSLPCDPPEGNPPPEVTWRKDGEVVELLKGLPNKAFIIQSLGPEHAGVYQCFATNVANTRRSRKATILIEVPVPGTDDWKVVGPPTSGEDEGGDEQVDSEATTSPDYGDASTTTWNPGKKCNDMLLTCNVHMPLNLPNTTGCGSGPRFIECIERFQEECEGVVDRESINAAEGTKNTVHKICVTGMVCDELMDCVNVYTQQTVPNVDVPPMVILCEGIHDFLTCAHTAANACSIPQDNPDTTLTQLAQWFDQYCTKVVAMDWVRECSSMAQCDLPIKQTTILPNLVQASLWCPYVKDTMKCTWRAVSDCYVDGMDEVLKQLDRKARDTCPSDDDMQPEGEGDATDELETSQSEDDGSGEASATRASVLLTSLLPVLFVWLTRR